MEVAEAYVSILPSTKGFAGKLDGAISGDMGKAGAKGGKVFSAGMGGALGGMATKIFAPLAAAAAGMQLGKFFAEGVSGASDLAEATSAVEVVFGKGAGAVRDFAKGAATGLGQTQVQAMAAAKTFGTFGKAAGLSGTGLAKFSTDFVGLSSDLASFNNTSPEQAIEAIGAALRGESEPIRAYGVMLDDASMRAEALKLGLIKTTKEALTPQQKVLAAQALIYKQTSDAQGDFERTSGGLANQQRILSAQWSELKTTLGAALLPAVTSLAQTMNKLLGPAIEAAGPFVERLTSGFSGLFSGIGGGAGKFQPLIAGFRDFGAAVGPALLGVFDALRGAFTTLLPAFQGFAEKVLGVLGPGLAAIGDLIGSKLLPALQGIIPVLAPVVAFLVDTVGGAMAGALDAVVAVVKGVIGILSGLIDFVSSVFKGDWSGAWDAIKDILQAAYDAMIGVVKGALRAIGSVLGSALDAIRAVWDRTWDAIETLLRNVWGGIVGALRGWVGTVSGLISGMVTSVLGFWVNLWTETVSKVRGGIDAVIGWLDTIKDRAVGAVGGAIGWLVDAGKDVIGGMLDGIREVIGGVATLVGSLKGRVQEALSGAASWLVATGKNVIGGMVSGIGEVIGNVAGALGSIDDKVRGALSGAASWLYGAGQNIVEGLISGIRSMAGRIVSTLVGLLPGPLRKFAGALGISSPSKVFAEFGRNIGEGLIVGVDSMQRDVNRSMSRLADAAAGVTDAPTRVASARLSNTPPAVGAPGAGAGAGVVFTGPVTTTDVGELARQLVTRQRDALTLLVGAGVA